MQLNWVDWIILIVVIFYVFEGWNTGIVSLAGNLISFLLSLWFAIKYHAVAGNFLAEKFGIPTLWTTVLGYLLVAIFVEAVLSEISRWFLSRLPPKVLSSKVNQWFGALLSAVNSLVLIAFFLLILLALPVRGTVKQDVKRSSIGSRLVLYAEKYGGSVKSSLNEVTQQAIKFLTVKPQSNERINLDVSPQFSDLVADEEVERRMIELVNEERVKAGVGKLVVDNRMTVVARNHSRDMFERRYFSHIDLSGHDAKDRMEQAGIPFQVVGENLAYAPDVATAHRGLMESEHHRRNILDPQFHRIGIGVIDSGSYGKMFTQLFAD